MNPKFSIEIPERGKVSVNISATSEEIVTMLRYVMEADDNIRTGVVAAVTMYFLDLAALYKHVVRVTENKNINDN